MAWDELTDAQQAFCDYVDSYKGVHGIKPRWLSPEAGDAEYWREETRRLIEAEKQMIRAEQAALRAHAAWKKKVTDPSPLLWNPFKNLSVSKN